MFIAVGTREVEVEVEFGFECEEEEVEEERSVRIVRRKRSLSAIVRCCLGMLSWWIVCFCLEVW